MSWSFLAIGRIYEDVVADGLVERGGVFPILFEGIREADDFGVVRAINDDIGGIGEGIEAGGVIGSGDDDIEAILAVIFFVGVSAAAEGEVRWYGVGGGLGDEADFAGVAEFIGEVGDDGGAVFGAGGELPGLLSEGLGEVEVTLVVGV